MTLSFFMPSVTGIEAQSHAMTTVSMNIANMRTVGYKNQSTMFYTMLGTRPVSSNNQAGLSSSRADILGVGYYDRTAVTRQGEIAQTGNNYDVAINGNGNAFFAVRDEDGSIYYTRAGDFATRAVSGIPYLVTNNGLYLQGFAANGDGTFSNSLTDLRIDYPNSVPSTPTTRVEIQANVPANGVDDSTYGMTFYGPEHDGKSVIMRFTKVDGKVGVWEVNFTAQDGTVSMAPQEVHFSQDGELLSPKTLSLGVTWSDGTSNPNVTIDISSMTQFTGNSGITSMLNNGRPSGGFITGYIDNDGILKAKYTNGDVLDYAQIALVGFVAPENLTNVTGTLFGYNTAVGNQFYVSGPNAYNRQIFVPGAVESSTSNVEEDFANMILIQRAYAMNGKTFTAANEMMMQVVNLKT